MHYISQIDSRVVTKTFIIIGKNCYVCLLTTEQVKIF